MALARPISPWLVCFFGGGALLGACGSDTSGTSAGASAGMGGAAHGGSAGGAGVTSSAGSTASGAGGNAGKSGTISGGSAGLEAGASGAGGSAMAGAGAASDAGSAGASSAGASGACSTSTGKALLFDGDAVDLVKSFCLEGAGTPDCSQPDPTITDLPIARASRTVELWAWFSGPKAWRAEHSLFEYGKGQPCHVFGVDVEHYNDNDAELDPYGNGCGADNTLKLVPTVPEVGWLHIAWAYDGPSNTFQFTVNGIAQPIPSKMATDAWSTTQSPLTIGAAAEFGLNGFDGKIDELRVWNLSRSVSDIARDKNTILKGDEPGLVAYYHFDEGQGTQSADATGKPGHTAFMINDAKPKWVDSDIPGPFRCAP